MEPHKAHQMTQHGPKKVAQNNPQHKKLCVGGCFSPPETCMEPQKAHQMTQHGPNIDPKRPKMAQCILELEPQENPNDLFFVGIFSGPKKYPKGKVFV